MSSSRALPDGTGSRPADGTGCAVSAVPASIPSAKKKRSKHQFFMVYSPEGSTPPVKVHPTHVQALWAAWEMAKLHPGNTFFVMGSMSRPCIASGTEARSGETACGLDPKDDGPTGEAGDAQPTDPTDLSDPSHEH